MKVKVNWKELGKQLWAAVKPVLLAAIGGGIVSVAAARRASQCRTGKFGSSDKSEKACSLAA